MAKTALLPNTDEASISGSNSGPSSSFLSSLERHEDEPVSKHSIARKETRRVLYSKVLIGIVLFSSAAFAGAFTYTFLRNQEETEFQRDFEIYVNDLLTVSEAHANTTFLNMAAFGSELTSLANYGKMKWPFVTVDDFHVRANDYQRLSGAVSNVICPVVPEHKRAAWVNYSLANRRWLHKGYEYMNITDGDDTVPPMLYIFGENSSVLPVEGPGTITTAWQSYPTSNYLMNFNFDSTPLFTVPKKAADIGRRGILTSLDVIDINDSYGFPTSIVLQPVLESFADRANIVAYLSVHIPWNVFFDNVFSDDSFPVQVVVSNVCGGVFTLEIVGPEVLFLGHSDLHDPTMDDWVMTNQFASNSNIYLTESEAAGEERCLHVLKVYPSHQMKEDYHTLLPLGMTLGVVLVFVFTSLAFIFYDYLLQRQNRRVANTVYRSSELVSNLFPKEYHDRLFGDNIEDGEFLHKASVKSPLLLGGHSVPAPFTEQEESHHEDGNGVEMYTSPPVADLFHDCTVLEADIAGFTAWSSTREPSMVFELLESLYGAFDEIAQRRRVFKVETVGDAYVAVAGLPTPRRDHAAVMVRFAHDCLTKMTALTNELEVRLGPGTAALSMRFGLHSGSVTAGVLRGDGLRFQIFGDTVDIAEVLEKYSGHNKIHVSEETAQLLRLAGKSQWLKPLEKKFSIQSKGMVQTYWVFPKTQDASSTQSGSSAEQGNNNQFVLKPERAQLQPQTYPSSSKLGSEDEHTLDPKSHRLVEWNVKILSRILKQVVAKRQGSLIQLSLGDIAESSLTTGDGMTPLEEVKEIVHLPTYCKMKREVNPEDVELSHAVQQQLQTLVLTFATQYRNDNAFHNFEHASHVTMSVVKLLSRIIQPEGVDGADALHDRTYGITSDPLLQFAVVLSALVHDLDHSGVPNVTLVKEGNKLAAQYKNKSVAEQHSVDLAWSILMDSKYDDLRKCIYSTQEELERFRSVLINVVLATDIADKDLGALRKARWNKAFKLGDAADHLDENPKDAVDRKATIVVEHLIQACDIAHTMQHWHVYRKWNEKLFQEILAAYKAGRLDVDPALRWYEGEIGFFDFYIIPLAKKLKDCGVFGVSGDEYLDYALANRREWVERGRDVVEEYKREYDANF